MPIPVENKIMMAIALLLFGSLYVKMFWCKYVCPLGACVNLFRFSLLFAGIVVLIWVLGLTSFSNGWVWGLGIACLFSYIVEVTGLEQKTWSLLRIVRNENTCTTCGMCVKKCPYSIPVNRLRKVKDIDCTLCGDCVACCPEDAISVSRACSWVVYCFTASTNLRIYELGPVPHHSSISHR